MDTEHVLEPAKARELIASNRATALDIRDDEEWRDKRVPGALHAAEQELEAALDEVEEDQIVLVVCNDGERSAAVAEKLREGGREAACIDGGMEAWEGEKFPMQPSTDPDDDVIV